MDKKRLMQEMQKQWEKYWKLDFFIKNGWKRQQCKKCGKHFWSLKEQEICNDSSCKPYEFLERKIMNKKYNYFEAWDAIKNFFKSKGHHVLERYPTVCRWFPLYFTIAGIVDFYRMDRDKFVFEFPKSPVILLQPSLRFNDIENVGKTGRHWTCHGHIEQASVSYWKEKTIELDFELLTKVFGIDPEEINFIEDVWLGPGAFGYSLEYHVAGLELGNCVFTEFSGTPDNYQKIDPPVVDMGAGIERFCWMSQQTPTSYDAVLGPVIEKLLKKTNVVYDKDLFLKYSKLSGNLNLDENTDVESTNTEIANQLGLSVNELKNKIEPIQAIYAIIDHARTLCYAIADGGIPSNVGGGYNLRVILRRCFELIERFNFNFDLEFVCREIAQFFKPINPELEENIERLEKIIDIERKRYYETKKRMKKILENIKNIDEEKMIELYDSHGITPEMLKQIDPNLKIPSDFYSKITKRHEKSKPTEIKECDYNLPKTDKTMIYNNIYEFDTKVIDIQEEKVVLDRTAFYPTGGGQEFDKGTINGCKIYNVIDCNGVVVHYVEKPNFKTGDVVKCIIDKDARLQIMKHHSATHLINLCCQKILGPHIWQEGSKKDVDKAHLDISHYDSITNEQIKEIENLANDYIKQSIPIIKEKLPRIEAEQKYGFRIYQGAPVPLKELTIISIDDLEHEACGGLHLNNTNEIERIHIFRTSKVQDGIYRLEFVAGNKLVKKTIEKWENIRKKEKQELEKKKKRIEEEKKKLKEIKKNIDNIISENNIEINKINKVNTDNIKVLEEIGRKLVDKYSSDYIVLVGLGFVYGIKGEKCTEDIESIVKIIASKMGGSAGGRNNEFRGGGPKKEIRL
ncbi:MAG: alanine--tRNA ligase [Candidatus Aenigmarchaeota archaeon]|nr:alanine--tRNA ligase [Candidatus Aenigmarchaeota archaeon]